MYIVIYLVCVYIYIYILSLSACGSQLAGLIIWFNSVHCYLTCRLCYEWTAQLESTGHKVVLQQESFILTIITPLMLRILQTYSTQPQSIFIDSSILCDQVNTSLTLVLIATKTGAVPIGVSHHDCQTEASNNTVFSQLHELSVQFS